MIKYWKQIQGTKYDIYTTNIVGLLKVCTQVKEKGSEFWVIPKAEGTKKGGGMQRNTKCKKLTNWAKFRRCQKSKIWKTISRSLQIPSLSMDSLHGYEREQNVISGKEIKIKIGMGFIKVNEY